MSWQRLSSFAPTPLASLLQALLQRAKFPEGQGLNILSLREGREEEEKLKVPWEEWEVDSRNNFLPVHCHRMEGGQQDSWEARRDLPLLWLKTMGRLGEDLGGSGNLNTVI